MQESQRYKNLIRQHIDLQTIQSRLDKGVYSFSIQKFFRDLLLLFNNGVVFFKQNSSEYLAACELRAQVLKEMAKELGNRKPQTVKPEPETKQQPTSFSKPNKSSSAIIPCGKGNNSAKATAAVPETASKKGSSGDKKDKEVEEKSKANSKKTAPSFPKLEDKSTIRKKRTKDQRSVSSNRNSNTSTKNTDTKHKFGGNELSSHDTLEIKVEKKANINTTSKRQGAASFLKRMKQNSPSQVNDDESSEEELEEEEEEEEEEREESKKEKSREE